jgi:hypothetical protein
VENENMIGGLMKTSSHFAIAAAAGILMNGVAMMPVQAADLGGDCCADLEERVAELEATTVRHGNRKVTLEISGAVAEAIIIWDDGIENDTNVINPDTFGNGITLKGEGKIHSDLSAGYVINMDWRIGNPFDAPGASGAALGSLQDYNNGTSVVKVVQQYVYLDSKSAGRLSLGRRNGTYKSFNDGAFDLAGADYMSATSGRAGGLKVRGDLGGTGADWYDVVGNIGGTRDNIIRYDSPTLSGFTVSASWGADDFAGVGAAYSGNWSGTDVTAGIAYEQNTTNSLSDINNEKLLVAASFYNTSSGIFLTGEYNIGYRDVSDDAIAWYLKGGWRKNVNGLGETIIYGSYLRGEDLTLGVEAAGWTIGMQQNIDAVGAAVFWNYDNRQILSGDALVGNGNCVADCGDLNTFVAGMKVAF